MSDRDTFIEEVTEEVRRDRLYALWRSYGPFAIGGIVAIVIAAAVMTWMESQADAAAQAAGGDLLAASEGTPADQAAALAALADRSDHEGKALVARLRAAAAHALAGEVGEAVALYDLVASDSDAPPLLQDFAVYRAQSLTAKDLEPAARAEAWSALANGNGAFRLLAIEARGVALFQAGDAEGAATELRAVLADEEAPQGLRARIEATAQALGLSLDN